MPLGWVRSVFESLSGHWSAVWPRAIIFTSLGFGFPSRTKAADAPPLGMLWKDENVHLFGKCRLNSEKQLAQSHPNGQRVWDSNSDLTGSLDLADGGRWRLSPNLSSLDSFPRSGEQWSAWWSPADLPTVMGEGSSAQRRTQVWWHKGDHSKGWHQAAGHSVIPLSSSDSPSPTLSTEFPLSFFLCEPGAPMRPLNPSPLSEPVTFTESLLQASTTAGHWAPFSCPSSESSSLPLHWAWQPPPAPLLPLPAPAELLLGSQAVSPTPTSSHHSVKGT